MDWHNKEKINFPKDYNKNIYDYSDLLKRFKDVEKSHLSSENRSIKKHLNSISCSIDDFSDFNGGFIILDDISSSGKTIRACKMILEDHGVDKDKMVGLVIAETLPRESFRFRDNKMVFQRSLIEL